MKRRAGWVALLITLLSLVLPVSGWAGSSQATLAVAVVVSARCAVRVPGSMTAAVAPGTAGLESVAMRCTKGALPSTTAGPSNANAVAPKITRDLVAEAVISTPRPASEAGSPATEALGPHLVVTVNF